MVVDLSETGIMQYGFICVPSVRSMAILTQVRTPDTGLGTLSILPFPHQCQTGSRPSRVINETLPSDGG